MKVERDNLWDFYLKKNQMIIRSFQIAAYYN